MPVINVIISSPYRLSPQDACDEVDDAVASSKGINKDDAREVVCLLMQAGGANNAPASLAVTASIGIGDNTKDLTLKVGEFEQVLKALKKQKPREFLKFTALQYARHRSQECYNVGKKHKVVGDLAKKLIDLYGWMSEEESYWCSSFQIKSELCPTDVQERLVRYKVEFAKSSKKK